MTPEEALAFLRKKAYLWAEKSTKAGQEEERSSKIEEATGVVERALRSR